MKEKLLEYGMEVPGNILCSDDASMVEDAINEWIEKAWIWWCAQGYERGPGRPDASCHPERIG